MSVRKYPIFTTMLQTLPIHIGLVGLLNYLRWGDMIGTPDFNDQFGVFDLVVVTVLAASVPALVAGVLVAVLVRRFPGTWSTAAALVIFAIAMLCSHLFYFRETHPLC